MSASLRVGIAGAGWVAGDRHLPALLARDDVDVVAIHDRTRARAAELARPAAERGHTVLATDSVDELIGVGLDVLHVTTSPWAHHDLAIAALASGAHVFTEKPMAMNLAEATAMVDAARAADRLLCVSHNFLWSDAMQRADRALGGNPVEYVLGLQLSAHTRRLPTWYRDLPGGLMFDEVPHMLYTLDHLLGGGLTLDHVRAALDDDGQPRQVELLVRGADAPGQVTMVFGAAVSEWHVLACAPHTTVGLDLFRDITTSVRPDGKHGALDIARTSLGAIAGHTLGFARAGARLVRGRQSWGHQDLIWAFLDAVQSGGTSPVRPEDALGIVALTDDVIGELDRR